MDEYNKKIKDFTWPSYESSDRPDCVPKPRSVKKLKGKAVSLWVHLRNFPLLIEKFIVDKDDPIVALALKLHEVTERTSATEFHEYEIQLLDDAIVDYLNMRKEARNQHPDLFNRPKPKHHFLRLVQEFVILLNFPTIFFSKQLCLISSSIFYAKKVCIFSMWWS